MWVLCAGAVLLGLAQPIQELQEDFQPLHEEQSMDSGVKFTTLRQGKGALALDGSEVTTMLLIYSRKEGELIENGTLLQEEKQQVLDLGSGKAIVGLEQGVVGMKVGEIRKIVVPPIEGINPLASSLVRNFAGNDDAPEILAYVELVSIDKLPKKEPKIKFRKGKKSRSKRGRKGRRGTRRDEL
eukprot:Hpha_TRINITY_DN2537_c0_g1::TRINITY_DN2537_c0_g1_i1::g.1449::m.1449